MNQVTDAARYPANVFWSDEDEGYIAVAPDLPGCSAFGETQSQALSELHEAIAAWVEAARSAGNTVPRPSRPSVEPLASGKVLLRMPRSLHAELVQGAKRDNVSLNHYVVYLLTTSHTRHQFAVNQSTDLWQHYHFANLVVGEPQQLVQVNRDVTEITALAYQGHLSHYSQLTIAPRLSGARVPRKQRAVQ
jgi:predicted RNase H-like HicB family nuclease